jgi:hypothetical protein
MTSSYVHDFAEGRHLKNEGHPTSDKDRKKNREGHEKEGENAIFQVNETQKTMSSQGRTPEERWEGI